MSVTIRELHNVIRGHSNLYLRLVKTFRNENLDDVSYLNTNTIYYSLYSLRNQQMITSKGLRSPFHPEDIYLGKSAEEFTDAIRERPIDPSESLIAKVSANILTLPFEKFLRENFSNKLTAGGYVALEGNKEKFLYIGLEDESLISSITRAFKKLEVIKNSNSHYLINPITSTNLIHIPKDFKQYKKLALFLIKNPTEVKVYIPNKSFESDDYKISKTPYNEIQFPEDQLQHLIERFPEFGNIILE